MKKEVEKEKVLQKKEFITQKKLDILIAVFLGLATLLVAWAGWIGSLHEGNQATNFTTSNNLAAEGNAEYNVAAQIYLSDLFVWNTIFNLKIDYEAALEKGNLDEAEIIEIKIKKTIKDNCTPKLLEAINEIDLHDEITSPFENEEFVNGYFESAKKLLDESQKRLEEGKKDNLYDDSYELVSVIYSVVLFLLGIVGVFKDFQYRKKLFILSVCILIFGFIYMLTIPMPTGFNITNFFK